MWARDLAAPDVRIAVSRDVRSMHSGPKVTLAAKPIRSILKAAPAAPAVALGISPDATPPAGAILVAPRIRGPKDVLGWVV